MLMMMKSTHLVRRLSSIVEPLLVRPAEEKHPCTAVLFDDVDDYRDDDNDVDDDDGNK